MIKALVILSSLFLSSAAAAQQDFQVTQFIYDKVNVNPAYAGANYTSTLSAIDNSLLGGGTVLASGQVARATARLLDSGVGLALSFESFTVGDFRSTEVGGVYAYHIRVGEEQFLSLGLEGSYRLITSSLFANPFQPPITIGQGEANFGGLYYNETFYMGLSVQNLFGSRIDDPFGGDIPLSSGKRLYRGMLGTVFSIGNQSELQPNIQSAYTEGVSLGYDVNLMYVWKRTFSAGLSYRYANFQESITRDNIDLIIQLKVNDRLRIGTGITFPQASASVQTGGGELSAIWVWSSEERPYKALPFF